MLYLVRMLGLFMVLPVLPLFVEEIAGATPLTIGIAIGIYGLSQGVLQIPFGLLSDRFGRKPMIAAGLVLFVLGSVIAWQATDIAGMILGRFLQGCGAIAGSLLALMSDLTRVSQRSRSMAIIGIAIASSFGLSLVLGPWVANDWGVSGIFLVSACLGVLALGLLFTVIPSPKLKSSNLDASVQGNLLGRVLRDGSLWRLNISVFSLHFLLVSAFSAYPLLLAATGDVQPGDYSLYYLGLLLGSFLLMLPFMWLSDRLPDVRPVLLGMVALCGISFLVLNAGHGLGFVMAGIVLFFMGFNLLEVILPAQVSKTAAAGYRGTAMGAYTTCQFLGIFAGGLVSGWILSRADIETLMYANAVFTLLWFAISATLPATARLGNRTVLLGSLDDQSAQQCIDGLLSVDGVLDVAIIEAEKVAYLKIDEQIINNEQLDSIVGSAGSRK